MTVTAIPHTIIWAFLAAKTALTALVGTDPIGIYSPNVPAGADRPAISYSVRGGPRSDPYIPGIQKVSVQFDCWADSFLEARALSLALFNSLQGVQNEVVSVDGTDYKILGATAETPGQDLQDVDIPTWFRVLQFYEIMVKCE